MRKPDRPAAATAAPHHSLSVKGRVGILALDFDAVFAAPWTVLFGPSGCGKSTLLRAFCGFTANHNELAVRCLRYDTATAAPLTLQADGRATPPEDRRMAYAPQQAGLFPHLSVTENIAFARSVRSSSGFGSGIGRTDIRELLSLFQLETLANRRPQQLSGGERQRVSLARALAVPDARLMLLDEPFAGVDRALRDDLVPKVQAFLTDRQIPAISVTHDVDEAFLLGAGVIRLRDGRNVAQGPAKDVLAEEARRITEILNRSA